jgi:hypothetical protein
MAERRPSVFIGSSTEGHEVAAAIQVNLDRACEVVLWSQGVFGLSEGTLETLVDKAEDFDFAILALTPDDMVRSRGKTQQIPRDNVLLELGLFIGVLGRKRTFIVFDRTANIKLPSDMAGVTLAGYQPHSTGNLRSSVGACCTELTTAIKELGLRPRPQPSFEIDQNTHFQIICDLLDEAARQFFILMHEQNVALRREPMFGTGVSYTFVHQRRASGDGYFGVTNLCKRLADAGLLQIDLRDNLTLTSRGHHFAIWLVERGHKADYFKTGLGGWGGDEGPPFPPVPSWPDMSAKPGTAPDSGGLKEHRGSHSPRRRPG